jgi:3-hydroxyisobutyrate dehydrogenase-like beta-hydroxyacid dehydrogenase
MFSSVKRMQKAPRLKDVAFVSLGVMGGAMAHNLIRKSGGSMLLLLENIARAEHLAPITPAKAN